MVVDGNCEVSSVKNLHGTSDKLDCRVQRVDSAVKDFLHTQITREAGKNNICTRNTWKGLQRRKSQKWLQDM
jgi:hypothetical protein